MPRDEFHADEAGEVKHGGAAGGRVADRAAIGHASDDETEARARREATASPTDRSSSPTTVAPRARSASAMAEPMKPHAPVTRTR